MSEPLFTKYNETILHDYPPNTSSPKSYIIIKNGETKYRLYFIDEDYVQLSSEENNHLIQSGDIFHDYITSIFKITANDILERQNNDNGLQQNELVIDGHDLYNPFKVQGLADALDLYLEFGDVASQDVTMQDAEQEQVLLSQDPDDPNAPIALRF